MPRPTAKPASPELSSALVLLVFAGGSTLDAILRVVARYSPSPVAFPQLLLAAVPVLICLGVFICLRGRRDLAGTMAVQLFLGVLVGVLGTGSTLPLSWYLGIGLALWAMRLGVNLLTWAGMSLLVLAGGAQFGLVQYAGVLFLPFALTAPLFLGAAAYFQWHQVRHRQLEPDLDEDPAREILLRRYGGNPGH